MSLPKNWVSAGLGELSTKIGSGATPRGGKATYGRTGIPLIRSMNVHFGEFKRQGLAHLDDDQAQALQNVTVCEHDVLLNITGASIGRVCLAPRDMSGARVNQHVCIIRAVGEVLPTYVERFLAAPEIQRKILSENYGFTRQALTKEMIEKFLVPVPPAAEQRRIVAKLDVLTTRLSRARAELDRASVLALKLRAAILLSNFSEEAARRWPRVTIEGILAEGLIGLVRSKEEQQSAGTPYIRMNHYDLEGRWNNDKLTYVSCSEEEIRRFTLRRGDVLFNTRNSVELVGKVAIWPGGKEGFVYNNNILRMRFRDGVFAEFIGLYMMSPPFQDTLAQHKSATTSVAAIYQRSLYKLLIPIPPLEEQHEIVLRIATAFARANRIETEVAQARTLFDGLEAAILAKAFRGELVPQDPNDEPASVLLDRIRAQKIASTRAKQNPRTGRRVTA